MSRTAIATLSTGNLLDNLEVIRAKAPQSKVIAMVKANAYGHGIRSVSQRLDKHIDMLGVASIDEATALRKSGVKAPIMLMEGVFEPSELIIASTERLHVAFHEETQLQWIEKLVCPLPISAWIKIDTGMGRLGFRLDKVQEAYQCLNLSKNIAKPVRILSHFACADEPEHALNMIQKEAFAQITSVIDSEYSFSNSGAIFSFPECHYDYVRPGLALYGVSPFANQTAEELGLKPVMTLQTSLIAVRMQSKGSSIGYGGRYTCQENMPVGIVAFGYGDGYPRTARDGTPILINNVRCPLIGRVSMDMLAVDLRNCPQAQVGDPVVLWGDGLPIEEVAKYTHNIPYDLLTGVQNRVKFYWTGLE